MPISGMKPVKYPIRQQLKNIFYQTAYMAVKYNIYVYFEFLDITWAKIWNLNPANETYSL